MQKKLTNANNNTARRTFIEYQLRLYKANKGILKAIAAQGRPAPHDIAWYVEAIDDYLRIASEEDRLLLQQRYFAPRPLAAKHVADILFVSRGTFYIRRNRMLDWLDKRMGNPAFD